MLLYAHIAVHDGLQQFGVKGPNILSVLPNFDVARGFVPGYMHAVLLGVLRQFVNLWFDSTSHQQPYFLGQHIQQIDSLIVVIKPPSEVKRMPRSLQLSKYWKTSEWRNFLLFYSYVCLKDFLPKKFFIHWCLLMFAILKLMIVPISAEDIRFAELALYKFVVLVKELYGEEFVSFNVHLLTHVATSVERWVHSGAILHSFLKTRMVNY